VTFYVIRRIGVGILLLFIMSAMFFTLTRVTPGQPFSVGENPRVHQAQVNLRLHRLGLTDENGKPYPIPQQYVLYLGALVHGDLGDSYVYNVSVTTLLKQLSAEFPYVVVDTSAGLSEHTLAALDCATDAVLVCGMDVPSARGMRKELLLLNDLNLTPRRHVVLNFAERRGRLSVPDVQNAIGAKASVVLPRSKAIQLSTDQGVPLLQSGTRDPATNELRRLVALFPPTLRAPERRAPQETAPERVPQHRSPSAVST